jgi:hypothetical protein
MENFVSAIYVQRAAISLQALIIGGFCLRYFLFNGKGFNVFLR